MGNGRVAQRKLSGHPEQEQRPTKPMVGGSTPSTPATLSNSCPSIVEATEGLILGPKPKDRVDTHCHFSSTPEEIKGQNDVPQLPFSDGQGRILWSEESPTLEMPAMWEASERTANAPVQH